MQINRRFYTIDALRGIAALSVVFYHLSENLSEEFLKYFPNILKIFSLGFLGVPIFFVISGFVIFISINEKKVDLSYIGNFALRRSIRLDPTYWFSIALAFLLLHIKNAYLGTYEEFPSFNVVLLHIFYLQGFFSLGQPISAVYWTLCLEIQFYLFFIFSIFVFNTKKFLVKNHDIPVFIYFLFMAAIFSLAVDYGFIKVNIPGLFIKHWHYFFMGVISALYIKNYKNSSLFFKSLLIIEILFLITNPYNSYAIVGIVTFSYLFYAVKQQKLHTHMSNRTLQFLGKISYSLYLFHADLGWKVISFCKALLGPQLSIYETIISFILGILVSILFSYFVFLLIEAPTNKFSKYFKRGS